jgi:hypothetical protein
MQPPREPPRQALGRMIRDSLQVPGNLCDFLRAAVPAVADHFDYGRLRPLEREMIGGDWRAREADLLFEIPYLDAGVAAAVAILIEHQSDTDPFVPLRTLLIATGFWERVWRDWEQQKRPRPAFVLPPVVPIVLYTGTVPWGSNKTIADLLGAPAALHPFAPGWGPVFWNLAERTPEALLAGGPWMQFMALMRVSEAEQAEFIRVCTEAIRRVNTIREGEHVRWYELLRMMLIYAAWRRPEGDRQALAEIAERENPANHEEVRAMTQTAAEFLMEQGARQEALRRTRKYLRALLESRIGPLPEALSQQIEATTDVTKLEEAFDRALRKDKLEGFQL